MRLDQALYVGVANRPGPKPFNFDAFAHRNMELALLIAAIIGGAVVVVSVIYAVGVRWSWSLAGLPIAGVAALFSPLVGTSLAAAFCLAAGIGHQWQRKDAERGGVEAQRARERRGIYASTLGLRARRRRRSARVEADRLALGESAGGRVVTVPFGSRGGVRAFIPGSPGSGKTVDLAVHGAAYIGAGQGVAAIDPKADPALRDELERSARDHGRQFIEWTPQGPATYNPLGRGTVSEIVDKALGGEEWTEPHYLRQAQRYLNLELQAMRATGHWPPCLETVVRFIDVDRLEAIADRLEGEVEERVSSYLASLSQRSRSELSGVRDRLAVLAESELGRFLSRADGRPEIDLLTALGESAVVYFQLDADRFPLASQMLATAIVSDLVSLAGELQGRPMRALVLIDEFAAVAAEQVSRLLSRSRSAGLSVILATQAFADLTIVRPGDSSESLRRQVLSHVDYLVAHRQSEPEAAELLGQMAGTRPAWSVARRSNTKPFLQRSAFNWGSEEVTRRRTREFVRHPDEFKRLGVGEAIVIEPARQSPAELVHIWPG